MGIPGSSHTTFHLLKELL